MRPTHALKHFTLRQRAMDLGVHLDDFLPALEYAVQQEWLEPLDGAFFRLTEAGFETVSSPPAALPSPAQDGAPATGPVNVLQQWAVRRHHGADGEYRRRGAIRAAASATDAAKALLVGFMVEPLGVGAGVLVAMLTVLDYYGIKPHTAEARQVTQAPQFSQPAATPQDSVSSQNQSGGITAGTVNIYGQKQQRHLDQQGTSFPNSAKVSVAAVIGDGEAFAYAQEITDWMRSNGWTNVTGVNQAIFSGPVFGQGISHKPDGSFDIQIGNQR
jgi:hypothetical protein